MYRATTGLLEMTNKGGDAVQAHCAALWFAEKCFSSISFWRHVPPMWKILSRGAYGSHAQSQCCYALKGFSENALCAFVALQRRFKQRKAARKLQGWWRKKFYDPDAGVFACKVGKRRFARLAETLD